MILPIPGTDLTFRPIRQTVRLRLSVGLRTRVRFRVTVRVRVCVRVRMSCSVCDELYMNPRAYRL